MAPKLQTPKTSGKRQRHCPEQVLHLLVLSKLKREFDAWGLGSRNVNKLDCSMLASTTACNSSAPSGLDRLPSDIRVIVESDRVHG